MAAEAKLEAAKIDIKVARKEFLPSFNITGIWTFNTLASGTFFSWESSLAALLAGATQDIFKGGIKKANLKMKKAKYEELFENYRQTDLNATKEINSVLCFIKHSEEIEKNAKEKLTLEKKNLDNEKQKLKYGVISNEQFLKEKTKFLNIENEYIQAKTEKLINGFTLYKALGGTL